jgi:type II secretory pathway component PulJ
MTSIMHLQSTSAPHGRRLDRRAFTVSEVILSTSIMALLMVAAATAMKISLQGFDENDKTTRAMQGARGTLERLTRQLRTAEGVSFTQSSEPGMYQGQSVTMDVTTLVITAPKDSNDLQQVKYVHRIPMGGTVGGKLYYEYQEQGQGLTTPTLAMLGEEDDVDVESFDVQTVTAGTATASAKVQFVLNVGGRQFDFSSAVALRGYEY